MDKTWWEQTTNAARFIKRIADTMAEGKSIVLILPQKIPWYTTMCELIKGQIQRRDSRYSFDDIEAPEEKPGEFLLRHYCMEEKQAQYRPNKSYARFLAESDDIILNDRYLWVRGLSGRQCEEWVTFLSEYAKYKRKNITSAVFLLEIQEEKYRYGAKKGIVSFSFQKEISAYDKYIFCALAAAGISCADELRHYMAQVVSEICGEDMELCARCIRMGTRFLEDPYGKLTQIGQEEVRSDGEKFSVSITKEEVDRNVWEAQIRVIFPVIESYRGYFVKRYYEKIQKRLPISNSNGERILDPDELEIGTLLFMAAEGDLLISKKEHDRLHQFREARNTLAHMKRMGEQEVEAVLSAYKDFIA